jgi:hypothetical protein
MNVIISQLTETVFNLQKEVKRHTNEINELKSINAELTDKLKHNGDSVYISGSRILNSDETGLMKEWLGYAFKLQLLYSSYNDGDKAAAFHSRCDGYTNTLTLIETVNNRRFGAFTKLAWDNPNTGVYCSGDGTDFIFSLDNKRKFMDGTKQHTILCRYGVMPTFGAGNDIFIAEGYLSNTTSSTNFPFSYGVGEDVGKHYLCGTLNFQVKRIEVYNVIPSK